jgi:hypothetical protein
MANEEHLNLLKQGIDVWNDWIEKKIESVFLGGNFIEVDLRNANLYKANLCRAYFIGANLEGVNLSEANLSQANFVEANLTGANLSKVNLTLGSLAGANLEGANLEGANLTGVNLAPPAHQHFPSGCGRLAGTLIPSKLLRESASHTSKLLEVTRKTVITFNPGRFLQSKY